jgi:hypothetical protein
VNAVAPEAVEGFRALLPVGYAAGVRAYRQAVEAIDERALSAHYSDGLAFFHERFVPHLKRTLAELSGGAWDLDDHVAFAAGSDVDLMTHVVDAVASREPVSLFPGDWYGFLVGSSQPQSVRWDADGRGALACLCLPSVRNGHLTDAMVEFLGNADACLLNINLFPTLAADERRAVASAVSPVLGKSLLSVSFSRGFGLTASQLGVLLVPRDHPYRRRFQRQFDWLTFFHNAIAARAFMAMDVAELQRVDASRRAWVAAWLADRGLPAVATGTYYVKSFRPEAAAVVPDFLRPLVRDGVVRLCIKPPQAAVAVS